MRESLVLTLFSVFWLLLYAERGVDVQPPIISLDLDHMTDGHLFDVDTEHQDLLTRVCEVQVDTNQTCKQPTALAYDHHDGDLSDKIVQSITLIVASPPHTPEFKTSTRVQSISYQMRGKYQLDYDVEDKTGNVADQVSFLMLMRDTAPPYFDWVHWDGLTSTHGDAAIVSNRFIRGDGTEPMEWRVTLGLEACAGWTRHLSLPLPHAIDSYDGDVSNTVCSIVGKPDSRVEQYCYSDGFTAIVADTGTGNQVFNITAHDFAGTLGRHGRNNSIVASIETVVSDTLPPKMFCDDNDTGNLTQTLADLLGRPDRAHIFASQATCDTAAPAAAHAVHDCGRPFDPPAVACFDIHDSWTPIGIPAKPLTNVHVEYSPSLATMRPHNKNDPASAVRYTCTDSANNTVTNVHYVKVADLTPPLLQVDESSLVVHARGWQEVLQHTSEGDLPWTCSDICDDATNSQGLEIMNMRFDFFAGGTCGGGAYSCKDPDTGQDIICPGNDTSVTKLKVQLSNPSVGTQVVDRNGRLANIDASDYSSIAKDGSSWNYVPSGSYGLRYSCSDNAGNMAALCRTVQYERPVTIESLTEPFNMPVDEYEIKVEMNVVCPGSGPDSESGLNCLVGADVPVDTMQRAVAQRLGMQIQNVQVTFNTPQGALTTTSQPTLQSRRLMSESSGGSNYAIIVVITSKGGACRAKALSQSMYVWAQQFVETDIFSEIRLLPPARPPMSILTPAIMSTAVLEVSNDKSSDLGSSATNVKQNYSLTEETEDGIYRIPRDFPYYQRPVLSMVIKIGYWPLSHDIKTMGLSLGNMVATFLNISSSLVYCSCVSKKFLDTTPQRIDSWILISIDTTDVYSAHVTAAKINSHCVTNAEGFNLSQAIIGDRLFVDEKTGSAVNPPTYSLTGLDCSSEKSLLWAMFQHMQAEPKVQTLAMIRPPTFEPISQFCVRPKLSSISGSYFEVPAAAEGLHPTPTFTLPEDLQCVDPNGDGMIFNHRIFQVPNDSPQYGNVDYIDDPDVMLIQDAPPLTVVLDELGSQSVTYSCLDDIGVPSLLLARTVVVYSEFCPVCQLPDPIQQIEASFPYIPHTLKCSEPIPSVTMHVESVTCDSISSSENKELTVAADEVARCIDVEKTGTYVYTYHIIDEFGHLNDDLSCNPSRIYARTVIVKDTLRPMITLHHAQIISSDSHEPSRRLKRTDDAPSKHASMYQHLQTHLDALGLCVMCYGLVITVVLIFAYTSE